jgi:hypothetical protein
MVRVDHPTGTPQLLLAAFPSAGAIDEVSLGCRNLRYGAATQSQCLGFEAIEQTRVMLRTADEPAVFVVESVPRIWASGTRADVPCRAQTGSLRAFR